MTLPIFPRKTGVASVSISGESLTLRWVFPKREGLSIGGLRDLKRRGKSPVPGAVLSFDQGIETAKGERLKGWWAIVFPCFRNDGSRSFRWKRASRRRCAADDGSLYPGKESTMRFGAGC